MHRQASNFQRRRDRQGSPEGLAEELWEQAKASLEAEASPKGPAQTLANGTLALRSPTCEVSGRCGPAARCPLPAARCPLPAARCPLHAARCRATPLVRRASSEPTSAPSGGGDRLQALWGDSLNVVRCDGS
ncbi:protein of unknown function (plasmid) [Caballeronia sp. S22]